MTTNYADCLEGEGQNVRQLEQQHSMQQRARWSDDVTSSPDSAAVFQVGDDLNWRRSSSNMTDASDSFHTPVEELGGWSGTANDASEVDGSHAEMTFHPGQSPIPLYEEDYEGKLGDYDDIDDINCNSVSSAGNRFVGRDRRAMYVPSYMAGPELDIETEEFAQPPDTRRQLHLVSSQTETERRSQRSQQLKFERVELVSSSSSSSTVLTSGLQTERAEAQIISSSLPRQLMVRSSASRSFDRQSSSSLTSCSSPVASPVTDRGECLVVHPNKRSEITVKTKSKPSKGVDAYHGPKYGIAPTYAGPSDAEPVGKIQTSQSRPTRRSRNDVVVKAIVSDTRECIQATLVESRLVRSKEDDLGAGGGGGGGGGDGDSQRLQNEEGINPWTSDDQMAVDVVSSEGESELNRGKELFSVNQVNSTVAYEVSDEARDDDTAGQPLQETQPLEDRDANNQLPSLPMAMDEDREDTEEEQERQVVRGEVEMEIDQSKEEGMDNTTEAVPYDDATEETGLKRRGSIHPQRKPRENKRKGHPSSRAPPAASSSSGGKENYVQPIRMEEVSDAKPLHYYSQDSTISKSSNVLSFPNKTSDLAKRETTRTKSAAKSGSMDRLRKPRPGGGTQSSLGNAVNVPQREEPDLKSLDTSQGFSAEVFVIRMDVVLRRDESGYGLTIEGSQPVHVKAVRENGIAEKNGILPGDEIVKINGTYVYDWEHESVIKLIKAAGQFLSLTLQRDLPSELAHASNDQLSVLAHSRSSSRPKATQSLKAAETNHQKSKNQSQVSQSFSNVGKPARVGVRATDGRGGGGRQGGEVGSIRNASPHTATPLSSSEKVDLFNRENVSFAAGAPTLSGSTKAKGGTPKPIAVIGMDNDDLSEEEDVPINPIFNDLSLLKANMAHLAVFLNFLISNSEPAPMLFSMITDYYQTSLREAGSATRWAFEIYTTFLAPAAPLKLMVDDGMVRSIVNVLRNTKENELRTVFQPAENFVRETMILKHLKDFNNKQSIGLGTMFGVHDLKPNMDRHTELRIVDSTLSSHFERFISDDANDASQALAFCLVTFFRQIGFVGGRNSSLVEVCPSFICKDKKVLKYKLKKNYESKGHVFNPHQCTVITKCQNCEKMIWGIGFQGYQCSNCELVIHRRCADIVWQLCSGTLKRGKDPRRVVRDIIPGRSKPGREDSSASKSVFHFPTDEATTVPDKRADDAKAKPLVSSNEKVSNGSDDEKQSDSESERKQTNGRPSSWPTMIQENNSIVSAPSKIASVYGQLSDPDFDVESELPPLSEVISKEALRKLKGKERKKQEYINELFYTEKTHLRQLKVIERFFRRPVRNEGYAPSIVNAIFQNLDEVIEVHGNLNDAFKKLRAKKEVVTEIGETLVNLFSGDNGVKFREMAAKFCQDQFFALGYLKVTQKKDPRLFQILQDATLNPHSGRQELKDLLPREMQRLTKYPLLIDNICNCTPPDTEEHEQLIVALRSSKELLEQVNQAVRECENFRRTQDMQKRLDRKPIESSTHPTLLEFRSLDLTQHKMIYDGELTWRRSPRPVELHMALFEHFVVLLQKQDDRLVLRCQSTAVEDVKFNYSPIIKLAHLLTKDVATDKRAFFLVNKSNDAPQVHELIAKSKEEKNRWCMYIREAVEMYHKQYSNDGASKRTGPSQPSIASNRNAAGASFADMTDSLPRINRLDALDLNESMDDQRVEALDLATPTELIVSEEDSKESLPRADDRVLPELQQKNALIHETLCDKVKLLSDCHESSFIGDASAVEDDEQNLDVKALIAQGLDGVQRLSELGRDAVLQKLDEENAGGDDDDNVTISAMELININNRMQQVLALLTVGVMNKEEDHERLELELSTSRERHAAILGHLNINSDSHLEMRSLDSRRPPAINRPTSYMAALSETNYKHGPRTKEPSPFMTRLEETGHQSVLTLEPVSVDSQLTTQDEWNSDDQQVSTDTVSCI